ANAREHGLSPHGTRHAAWQPRVMPRSQAALSGHCPEPVPRLVRPTAARQARGPPWTQAVGPRSGSSSTGLGRHIDTPLPTNDWTSHDYPAAENLFTTETAGLPEVASPGVLLLHGGDRLDLRIGPGTR